MNDSPSQEIKKRVQRSAKKRNSSERKQTLKKKPAKKSAKAKQRKSSSSENFNTHWKENKDLWRKDAIEKRVIRGFKQVVKVHFESCCTQEMKENPKIFYNLILGVLVQFYEISKIEDNFCIKQALGMITYMTIKESKWEEFVLNFPTDHFSIDEKIDIINIVKEDIEMNNKLDQSIDVQASIFPINIIFFCITGS